MSLFYFTLCLAAFVIFRHRSNLLASARHRTTIQAKVKIERTAIVGAAAGEQLWQGIGTRRRQVSFGATTRNGVERMLGHVKQRLYPGIEVPRFG